MDSLIFLAKLCPSLPLFGSCCGWWGGLFDCYDDEWLRGPSGALCIFHQRSWMFPLCIPHHSLGHHIGTSRWHHFGWPQGLCPWVRPGGSWWFYHLWSGLNAIPTTDLFDAFKKTLCVGYDNVTLIFNFIGCRLGTCGAPISSLSGGLVKWWTD